MVRPTKQIKHRNAIKGFFITFPQSGSVTKDEFYDKFSTTFNVDKAIVASELHKDGNPHLHFAVVLKEPKTKSQLLSHFRGTYPDDFQRIDVESLISFPESIRYLTCPDKDKEVDPNPLLVNCEIPHQNSRRHDFIHHELRNRPIHERWETCGCPSCHNLYIEHRNREIREVFGDDEFVRNLFQN